MPFFNDAVDIVCVVGWVDHSVAALILLGGNAHYGLPPPAGAAGADASAAASVGAGAGAGAAAVVLPALNAATIATAIQIVVDALELPMQAYANVLLHAE